jgi:agmatinase
VANVSKNVIPIFLGGDHSITDPIYRGISKRSGKRVGLISFDTHFDYREPVEGFEHSGNWLRTLEDCINYESVALIGISAPVYSDYYMKSMDEAGAMVITPYDMRKTHFNELLSKIIHHMNKSCYEVYITVDIDVIDQ